MKIRPHDILFIAGAILLVSAFLFSADTVDIHAHDTYFVVGVTEFYIVLAFLLLLVGLLYWSFRRFFYSEQLAWIHVAIYLGTVMTLALFPTYGGSYIEISSLGSSLRNTIPVVTVALLVLSNIIFLVNLFLGLSRKKKVPKPPVEY